MSGSRRNRLRFRWQRGWSGNAGSLAHAQASGAGLHPLSGEPRGLLVNHVPHQQVLAGFRGRAEDRLQGHRIARRNVAGKVGARTIDKGPVRVSRRGDTKGESPRPFATVSGPRCVTVTGTITRSPGPQFVARRRFVGRRVEVVRVLAAEPDLRDLLAPDEEAEHGKIRKRRRRRARGPARTRRGRPEPRVRRARLPASR